MEKIKISLPIIVEGRYDKSTLASFLDATVITTGGFSVFNNKEKQALIRRLAKDGIIVLTDSDGGGRQIRSFLNGIVPSDKIHNLYIPKIEGKEKRKKTRSRAGLLGVEGMEREVILRALSPFALTDCGEEKEKKPITKLDFYLDGLSGGDGSREKRARLLDLAGLPDDMSANAMLEAFNLLFGREEYKSMLAECFPDISTADD